MVRGETRRIELKKNSITRLHQLEAESAGETRNEFQAVRVGFQRLPDELHVLWSSTPHPPFSRNYWQEHNDLRILAEARALACKAGRLLVAVRGPDEPKQTNVKSAPGPERLIRKVGDVWQLAFGWRFAYIKDLKGLVYILYLIQASNRSFHSMQLFSAAAGETEQPILGSAGEMIDQRAFEQYRNRLDDVETRLSEAERNCDQAQKEALLEERDRLEQELVAAVGLGGKQREAHDDREKVRKSVSNAIARAIDAIREHHPSLADHLQRHIECGSFLCYSGDDVPWEF
jgi:hypothetical protein